MLNSFNKKLLEMEPPSEEENMALLNKFIETQNDALAWEIVCRNSRLLVFMLLKKFPIRIITDDIFSDALYAYHHIIHKYKKQYSYTEFLRLANIYIIGCVCTQYKNNKSQVTIYSQNKLSGKIKERSVDEDRRGRKFYLRSDNTDLSPSEKVTNVSDSDFCKILMHGKKLLNLLTDSQKTVYNGMLKKKGNITDTAKLLGLSKQRVHVCKKAIKRKFFNFFVSHPTIKNELDYFNQGVNNEK